MACAYGCCRWEAGFCGGAACEWEGGRGLSGSGCTRGRGGGEGNREGEAVTDRMSLGKQAGSGHGTRHYPMSGWKGPI